MFRSQLCDESRFYQFFIQDMAGCHQELIIESPFISLRRMKLLMPVFRKLINRGVRIHIITRDPKQHNHKYEQQAEQVITRFETLGIQVLVAKNSHHRKLAIIDRQILWEGSLNILSHTRSREIMRRMEGGGMAQEMFDFLGLNRFISSSN